MLKLWIRYSVKLAKCPLLHSMAERIKTKTENLVPSVSEELIPKRF